jgi:hypothetical protein
VALEEFSLGMLSSARRFRELGDESSAGVISSSCIACLAHLAILYEAVCQADPVAGFKSRDPCDSALQRLGTLTSEVDFDEYSYLDLLLGVRPFLLYFPMPMSQMGGCDRILGGNHYQFLMPA